MATPHHPTGPAPAPGNPYTTPAGHTPAPGGPVPAAPGGHAAAAPVGYAAPAPGGHAAPGPAAAQAGTGPVYFVPPTTCRACGGQAVAHTKVRAHVGFLVVMRFEHLDGPFCRACGLSVVRQMTTRALMLGWWGPLSLVIFNPFTLLWNLRAHLTYRKLPPSAPAPGRTQLDPGPPVLKRPPAYVALVPLAWAIWVVTQIVAHA
ncbi:hypothetical protein [Streptomyces sp. NRRL S-87]|uniref:hypothetical protein n=1 Tax=Streptomyces sp. NRRL S-87 TaxID=1463920 RepID=UPI00068BCBBC|nr:hypothetical protein [Streptomyces sp. NRRL S-87]